ncbi:MAG: sodium pump decarboxylase subunit gamma [Arcobacter sp.]|nr:MAG: sodium pump decarboxylase subunit gamma [Arcobacter sp.]
MEVNLISEALKFMVLGMGIVFAFLIILIFVLKAQAKLLSKYFPAKEIEKPKKVQTASVPSTTKKVAAIIAAVQHHENLKGK